MACNTKQETINKLTKVLMKDLKATNTGMSHSDIKAKATTDAEALVAASIANMEEDFADEADARNALPGGAVQELNAANPKVGKAKVTVTEVNNGQVYVKFPNGTKEYPYSPGEVALDQKSTEGVINKYIGSSDTSTEDTFQDTYVDSDGSMNKSANLNEEFVAQDKVNNGVNFDTDHSEHLTGILERMVAMVNSLQDGKVKIRKKAMEKAIREMGASGSLNTSTGEVSVDMDTHGPGAEFRTKFSMGNQEVYVHELVHAAMNFMFDKSNLNVAKDPELLAMITNLENLHAKARKNSKWQDLLPGYENKSQQYSKREVAQAKGYKNKHGDWVQGKWDYIFNNKTPGNGLHEFMAGLLTNSAFKEAMEKVSTLDLKADKADEKLVEKIQNWFNNILEKIFGYATNKRDNSITKEGTRLIFDIMRANSNAVDRVARKSPMESVNKALDKAAAKIEVANDQVKKITDPFVTLGGFLDTAIANKSEVLDAKGVEEFVKLQRKVAKLVNRGREAKDGKGLIGLMNNVITTIDAVQRLLRALPSIYKMNKYAQGSKANKSMGKAFEKANNMLLESIHLAQDGMVRGIVRDFMDKPGIYNYLADSILRLTKSVDSAREAAYEGTLKGLNDGFGDVSIANDIVNKKHNEALTDVVLRTDIQSLGLDAKDLEELLRDPGEVSQRVAELEQGLSYEQIQDAESLANYMVTGVGTASNASNIASKFGHDRPNLDMDAATIKQIDQLVSYKALEMTPQESKETLASFLAGEQYVDYSTSLWNRALKKSQLSSKTPLSKSEYKKQVLEGTQHFIDRSRGLQAASEREMRSNPHNAIKGYVKDTYQSDASLEMHPIKDMQKLEREGFKFVRPLKAVPGTNTIYGLYVSTVPAVKRANGALGLQDRKSRGFTLQDVISRESANDTTGKWDGIRKHEAFRKLLKQTKADYKENKDVGMSPMYDQYGNIINFRATMSIAEKQEHLDLETRGTENLARSYSTMGTAATTDRHNREVIDLLYKDFLDNYKENSEDYVVIKPDDLTAEDYGMPMATAPQSVEEYSRLWARLPKGAKQYATEKFQGNQIVIKKELLQVAFGEDNYSITQSKLLEGLKPSTLATLKKVESVWQDTMQIAKSNIVIKTPEVLLGNLVSNFKILLYLGIHPVKGAKLMLTGARELKKYEADSKELASAYRNKDAGVDVSESYINDLKRSLQQNTVTPLMDAGLYQSIVEDVNTANESNQVAKWFSDKTDRYITNETANTAIQYLFMTQRTKPYQQLLKATQVSDFYFRYAQYYSAIDKADTGLDNANTLEEAYTQILKHTSPEFNSKLTMDETGLAKVKADPKYREAFKAKAMRDAIDNYINYEAPLEKHIRYGDAMGTWFFVKYFVKSQKVIKKLVKDNPLRVGADILAQTFITGDTADVLDSSILDKGLNTYNPLKIVSRLGEFIDPSLRGVVSNI